MIRETDVELLRQNEAEGGEKSARKNAKMEDIPSVLLTLFLLETKLQQTLNSKPLRKHLYQHNWQVPD